METANPTTKTPTVALRKESVDRNMRYINRHLHKHVALRKESVDRNDVIRPAIDVFLAVALRKESVDRNNGRLRAVQNTKMSLSARRAWIEIRIGGQSCNSTLSLSARRAWIEIMIHQKKSTRSLSARRAWIEILDTLVTTHVIMSLSARRAWIEIVILII